MMARRLARLLAVEGVTVGLALVGLIVYFSLKSEFFLDGENITNLFVQSMFILIVTLGMTFVLIAGGIDLSVGSVLGLTAGITLLVLQEGAPLPVALLAGLATGVVVGLLNGYLVSRFNVSDLIVTLGTLGIAAGLLEVLTAKTQLIGVDSSSFAYLANGEIANIPFPVILVVILVVVLEVVLRRTSFGRSVFAIGINVRRIRLGVYVLSGALAALAGILLASRLNSVQPGLGGQYELTAIAAAVLGGTSIAGGRGSIWRSVVGAMLLGVLSNGLQLLSVDPVWNTIIVGIAIIVAVAGDQAAQRWAMSALRGDSDVARPTRADRPSITARQGVSE
jgi:ribose transport system permease protein